MIKEKVDPYLEYCEYRKELDEKTLKAYRIDLRQYFEYFSEKEPDKEGIENYITELHKIYKQKTIKRKIASIKAFYNYLEEEGLISENPFRKIRVKFKEAIVLPRIIPRNEIEQLLNHMYATQKKGNKQWLRDIAVIETFFATGARICAIVPVPEYRSKRTCPSMLPAYSRTLLYRTSADIPLAYLRPMMRQTTAITISQPQVRKTATSSTTLYTRATVPWRKNTILPLPPRTMSMQR